MAEKKKKSAEEKKKLEEELDDQRGQHEKEVADLKEKLRQQKTSKDAASAQQVKDIEAELNRDWQTKCDRLVSAANELHKKELAEVKEELDKQQQLYKSQEGKLASTKTSREAREKKILSLEEQVEDLGVWKDKYEKLRSQASTMKERYEQRITELEETSQRTLQAGKRVAEERDAAVKRVGEVQEKARDAMRALREEAAKKGASGGGGDSSGEVKKIMNNVFRDLKSKFDAKKSYNGGDIQAQVLATIKEVTLQMIQSQKAPRDSGEKQVEEAEDQDGDDDEEEEETDDEEDAETEDSDEEEEEEDANKDVAETEVKVGEEESIDGDTKNKVQQTTRGKEITVTEALVKPGEDAEEGLLQNPADVVNQKDTPNEVPHQAHQSDIHGPIKDPSEVQTSPSEVQGKMTDSAEDEGGEHPADTEARDAGGDEPQARQSDANDSSLTDADTHDPKGAMSDPSLVIEEVMKEMSHMSGDSGNPHYAAELDRTSDSAGKSALEDSIAAMLEPSTDSTGKEPDKASKDLESRIAGMIEPTVSPSSKAAGEGTRKTDSSIKPATSHVTGDKGNPHYAKELEKSQGMSSVEARIESLIVPEGLVDNKDGAPGKTGVETPIEASQSNVSGDKGNPHYAKELEATSKLEAQIAGLIVTGEGKPSKTGDDTAKTDDGHVKARAAHSTGDKGNPHYAKQLEAGSKLEAQIEGLIVPNTGEEKPEKPSTLKDKGGARKTEDVIKASASQSTGDKGNPHYAKQLEDSNPCKLEASIAGLLVSETGSPKLDEGKSRSEESAIQPISSHTTGDKGNIHYAEELKKGDKKKDLESRIESLIQPESGSSSKQTTKLESQIESMIVPQTEGGNTDKGRGNASKTETAITPDSAHVTGDKGNIHYAKELEKSQDSKSSKSSLESQIESLIVTDAPSDKDDGGKKKSSSEGKGASDLESKLESLFDSGFESSIKEEKSHITGDKGNQHYKKELDKSGGKDGGSETANSAEAARKAKAALALFGDDEDEDGFSFLQKPADKVTKKATPDKKTNKQSKTEDDDTTRPRPPPLFGDSDDDDGELDWLS